jgi:diadenosine tetraphosphate (Ap4A) HIT family hydrolase
MIHDRVEKARKGINPTVICQMRSGWAVLGDIQFLRGYSLLLPDPVVDDLNSLDKTARCQYLYDMSVIGDALLEATGAWRINYDIMGNLEPALHAHIVPRFRDEPDDLRNGPPWAYYERGVDLVAFDSVNDRPLIDAIAMSIRKRLLNEDLTTSTT